MFEWSGHPGCHIPCSQCAGVSADQSEAGMSSDVANERAR